jgi:hypothetical protein
MRQIDMSPRAVTSRLKLASELTRLCLRLGAAKISEGETRGTRKEREVKNKSRERSRK